MPHEEQCCTSAQTPSGPRWPSSSAAPNASEVLQASIERQVVLTPMIVDFKVLK